MRAMRTISQVFLVGNAFGNTLVQWTDEADALLMDLIADGLSMRAVANRMDISYNAVSSRFTRLRAAMGSQAA